MWLTFSLIPLLLTTTRAVVDELRPPFTVVDMTLGPDVSASMKIAGRVCQGLANRDDSSFQTAIYLQGSGAISHGGSDAWWRNATGYGDDSTKTISLSAFLTSCLAVTKKFVRYNASMQKELLPSIIMTASALGAVPLEDGQLPSNQTALMVFDATKVFSGFTENDAVSYTWSHYGGQTTGLAKLNPGWKWQGGTLVQQVLGFFKPKLTGGLNDALVDFIVKERLFLMYLKDSCIPLSQDHRLMEKILNDPVNNKWDKPVRVFGYDDSHPLEGGDLFEAETACTKEHNMGQIASQGVTNLGFFSSSRIGRGPITQPLRQNPDPPLTKGIHGNEAGGYNASKTYVAFVIGDGDNVGYVQHSRQSWMEERLRRCADGAEGNPGAGYPGPNYNYSACFPLLWSLNPNLLRLAPDWVEWYYNTSYETGADYFVLPPSGDTYSYPSQIDSADMGEYVRRTEEDCFLMNTSGSVSWESAGTWGNALAPNGYYSKYAERGAVRTFYGVNVPYDFPVLEFKKDEHYRLLGGGATPAVVFKPQEWRGEGCAKSPPNNQWTCPTSAEMAARLNGFARGTVTQIYGTSDGGFGLHTLYALVPQLAEHVIVVNHNQLAAFAVQAAAWKEEGNREQILKGQ